MIFSLMFLTDVFSGFSILCPVFCSSVLNLAFSLVKLL